MVLPLPPIEIDFIVDLRAGERQLLEQISGDGLKPSPHAEMRAALIARTEDVLRIVREIEEGMGDSLNCKRHHASHSEWEKTLPGAVKAFVAQKNALIRFNGVNGLNDLSEFSHDVNNYVASVTLVLQALRQRLAADAGFARQLHIVELALATIA
jgi:hypothetical protein